MPAGSSPSTPGRLDAARALAEENGVADRIEFLQCDLADLPAVTRSFDVIAGMVYHNEPRGDLAQQQLIAGLATRFAHPGTVFIPDTVRYTVVGYDSASPDPTESTLQDRWESAVDGVEALTGLTCRPSAGSPALITPPSWDSSSLPRPWPARVSRALAGPDMTLLTSRELFTEISYADPATASAYPPALALTITEPGRLDTTIWRQELKFGDLLIRRTETTHPVTPPCDVRPGDTAVLSTDGGWGDAIPLIIRRDDHT